MSVSSVRRSAELVEIGRAQAQSVPPVPLAQLVAQSRISSNIGTRSIGGSPRGVVGLGLGDALGVAAGLAVALALEDVYQAVHQLEEAGGGRDQVHPSAPSRRRVSSARRARSATLGGTR